MSPGRKWLAGVGATLALSGAAFFWTGAHLESFLNRVEPVPLPQVQPLARQLHRSTLVVDLHADSLLFGRDLLERSSVGHLDLPRLQQGGVGLQVFSAVTVVPLGINIDRTDGRAPDLLTLAGWARLSPLARLGPLGRALLQAARLDSLAARSTGKLLPVRTRADLERLIEVRAATPDVVGVLLSVEGAHTLEGDPDKLDDLFAAGFRMIGLAHFFDNAFAGSAHGLEKGGLTERGRALVQRMEKLGVLVDLAHLSPAAIDDVLAITTKPTVFSHGGVRGTCDNARNLSDAQVRAIARGGGVIGIGYWETAVCGRELRDIVAAMRHVIALVGDDHVALGSDFDGATTTGLDASRLPSLTQQLLDEGVPGESIRKILGGNALRVLRQALPGG